VNFERDADEVNIVGRVIWAAKRLGVDLMTPGSILAIRAISVGLFDTEPQSWVL
jgi:hypothetical protein